MRVIFVVIMLVWAGEVRSATWQVGCQTLPRAIVCEAVIENPTGARFGVAIRRSADRVWRRPFLVTSAPGLGPGSGHPTYRVDGGRVFGAPEAGEVVDAEVIQALARGRRLIVGGPGRDALEFDVRGFQTAFEQLLRAAQNLGFTPLPAIPLDPVERAAWFVRNQIDEALNVPGSAEYPYFEVFRRPGSRFLVCVRYSALNAMGVRLRANRVLFELETETLVLDGHTHRVLRVLEEGRDSAGLGERWAADCRDQ
jgi:hypothetical protein